MRILKEKKGKKSRGLLLVYLLLISFLVAPSVKALSLSVHVSEKYAEVYPGERFYFELEIKYPENSSRKDLNINYEVVKDGDVVVRSKFVKAVETQASFMDYVVIPSSVKSGMCEIKVKVSDYGQLNEEIFSSFFIQKDRSREVRYYFFTILLVIFLVGILIVLDIVMSRRKRGILRKIFY